MASSRKLEELSTGVKREVKDWLNREYPNLPFHEDLINIAGELCIKYHFNKSLDERKNYKSVSAKLNKEIKSLKDLDSNKVESISIKFKGNKQKNKSIKIESWMLINMMISKIAEYGETYVLPSSLATETIRQYSKDLYKQLRGHFRNDSKTYRFISEYISISIINDNELGYEHKAIQQFLKPSKRK